MPRVSVGLPVYQGARYLQSTLESLRNQTLTDFEVLIADNASDDETGDIAMAVCAADRRFRYHKHARNLGAAANFNFTFHETTDSPLPVAFSRRCDRSDVPGTVRRCPRKPTKSRTRILKHFVLTRTAIRSACTSRPLAEVMAVHRPESGHSSDRVIPGHFFICASPCSA